MAVMLPPELSRFLNMIGFEWPEGNEDKVFDWGNAWLSYAGEVGSAHGTAQSARDHVGSNNEGPAIEAFLAHFNEPNQLEDVGTNLATAATICGGCLFVVGAAIIALKIAFVVNLVTLAIQVASAIAAAAATFGASMAWIPVARLIAQRAIEFAINLGVEKLLGG